MNMPLCSSFLCSHKTHTRTHIHTGQTRTCPHSAVSSLCCAEFGQGAGQIYLDNVSLMNGVHQNSTWPPVRISGLMNKRTLPVWAMPLHQEIKAGWTPVPHQRSRRSWTSIPDSADQRIMLSTTGFSYVQTH